MVSFIFNDLLFLGLSPQFYSLLVLRLGFLLSTALLLSYIRKEKTYQSYDRAEFTWGALAIILMLFINSTRPQNFIIHSVLAGVAILIVGLVIPIKLTQQIFLVSSCAIGEISVTILGVQLETLFAATSFFTITFSLILASAVTIVLSYQLQAYRRSNFKSIIERDQMKIEIEKHAKNLEKLVEEKTKQLKYSERLAAIGQTAGMVGHDLRNPLQTIIGELYLAKTEAQSLNEGKPKKNLLESIQEIDEAASYMDKIVSDLQAFVKSVEIKEETISLKEIVAKVLGSVVVPTNIFVQTRIEEDFPQINADPQLLKRVLINLVTNAVQAMPEVGTLIVGAKRINKGEIEVTVQDTGVGIPELIKPKIFLPLFTTKSRGQGFGLAVCKRVVEAHGGTIDFESQEGKGSSFFLRLPISSG